MTLVWKSGYSFDSDASTYIDAVEAADGQALETGVRVAINDFVLGCKQDDIWDAIKASCILAGARTLDGALVPLAGTAPTKYGTEVNWSYNRKTGLKGDGSTNYLDSQFLANDVSIGQDNRHLAAYPTNASNGNYVAVNSGAAVYNGLDSSSGNMRAATCVALADIYTAQTFISNGFFGWSRDSSSSAICRVSSQNKDITANSVAPPGLSWFVFCRNNSGVPNAFTISRLSFYSIGESLDLALLDTRVSNLMTAIGAAIP